MTISNLRKNIHTFHMAELHLLLSKSPTTLADLEYISKLPLKLAATYYNTFRSLQTSAGRAKARRVLYDNFTKYFSAMRTGVPGIVERKLFTKSDVKKLATQLALQNLKVWNN